jgi:hypothetical protein
MTPENEQVRAYLAAVERACADLPAGQRDELVAELRAHIEAELAELSGGHDAGGVSDLEVHALLDSLGAPSDIAAEAMRDSRNSGAAPAVPPQTGFGVRDISTIVLLLIGAIVVGIGWVVGVVLLWTSPSWRTRDKLIGTFLLPGGLVGSLLFLGVGATAAAQSCSSTGDGHTQCTGFAVPPGVGVSVAIFVALAPVFSAIWLVRTHRAPEATGYVSARFS